MIRRIIFLSFLLIFSLVKPCQIYAEVVDLKKEEKVFGEWKVFCEIDMMMDLSYCKMAVKFYENTAVLTVEPEPKILKKLFIVIPQIKVVSFVKIRVDQNDLILSRNVNSNDFGLIGLDDKQKEILYQQMLHGKSLFLRFYTRNSDKEVTVKINLDDFRNALNYTEIKASANNPQK